jgi:hypothetical protein
MKKADIFRIFNIDDLRVLPERIMQVISGDIKARDGIYSECLNVNRNDLSYDWFQGIYEEELSERGQKKQDFTPNSVGHLASLLTGNKNGIVHEPTAGNGSMIIADWYNRCQKSIVWDLFPSENMIDCWELSDRSIPLLLFNLSIRGIMGYVYHGDVLEKIVKQKYILLNRNDDVLAFSEIIPVELNVTICKNR